MSSLVFSRRQCLAFVRQRLLEVALVNRQRRIVSVNEVHDLTVEGPSVERELGLLKVAGKGDARVEALRLADIFRASVVDSTLESFIFEITGPPDKVDSFIALMRELGLVEVGRTGIVGMPPPNRCQLVPSFGDQNTPDSVPANNRSARSASC